MRDMHADVLVVEIHYLKMFFREKAFWHVLRNFFCSIHRMDLTYALTPNPF